MQLKEGKMSWRELSVWFGLKPDTITKRPSTKEKKLQRLKTFADFHLDEKKKLVIDKVYIPEYSKPFQIIEEEFPKRWGKQKDSKGEIIEALEEKRIDTCSRVGTEIWENVSEVKGQININTSKQYVSRVKKEQYGRNYVYERGTKGYSKYIWLNRDKTAPLNAEQLKILKECASQAYGNINLQMAAIEDDYRNGKLTEKEYFEAKGLLEISSGYDRFCELLMLNLGFIPEKQTQIIDIVKE